jgi:Zn-dependent protease
MTAPSAAAARCAGCRTELAPAMLSCPACHTLVYRDLLRSLATQATQESERGDLMEAKMTWQRARALLPPGVQQHSEIGARIASLDVSLRNLATAKSAKPKVVEGPRWRRLLSSIGAALLLALGKLKFLLLGLSKASTLFSMLAFFGVYWTMFGWPLAAGLVVSIYIHEMGHVAALVRMGIPASAPLFIPGLGALVRLRQHIDDPSTNAFIGLAGPLWGLGAAATAWATYLVSGVPVWGAIAHLGAYINLFNLVPVWQLDGARGMDALNRTQRVMLVAVVAITFALTHERMLVIIGLVSVYHVVRAPERKGDPRMLALFAALIAALGAMSTVRV